MSVNKVILMGYTGKDPDVKTFDNGGVVAQFTLATTKRGFTTKDGREIPEHTEWHNIVVRNKAAEICEKYLSKGDKIYIEGRIKSRQWQAEDGATKYTTEIQVTEFTFLTTKKETDLSKSSLPTGSIPDDSPY